MSNTAPSRADSVVVFPLGRWCPPQETSQPHPPHELCGPNGYHFISKHRNSRGGGVQSHLHYFERPDISTIESDMETVYIEISKEQLQIDKNILIGVIYRPPATDVRSFNDKLNVYLDKIRKENKICYLFGDFNINLLNHGTHNLTG